jgi:two-component system, chemotaxis family, protein-glutamate methylesterase/glutaminase
MANDNLINVLVVDDTLIYRKIVGDVLSEIPEVKVVGTANNGKAALARIAALQPDLLTLDVEMPEMNGLEVLEQIQRQNLNLGVVMFSSLTKRGSDITIKALELGAFDFIPKPEFGTLAENRQLLKNSLLPIIKAFARRKELKNILYSKIHQPSSSEVRSPHPKVLPSRQPVIAPKRTKSSIVGIGISTGGPNALARLLPQLPANLGVPILIVQHMPPIFTQSLANSLNMKSPLNIKEACDGEPVVPNTVFIAPGGKQMKVVAGQMADQKIIRITDDPPENSCKPSVDYLFRSLLEHYGGAVTGVIMTGMGSDGTAALKLMKKQGATIIAQDEATCVVFGMPKEPIDSGIVDVIAPLDKIAGEICLTVRL